MNLLKRWLCAGTLLLAMAAHAEYPDRPIRLVMPFGAGGASDSVARIIAPELAARLGQPVVIENHPGAQGAVAGQTVANAAPDGYTLLYAVSATAALPILTRTAYDMERDFRPVSTIGSFDFGLVVSAKVPVSDVREFIAYAKAHPGVLNYATLNLGEQYAAALFMHETGIRMVHVPYKSLAQILPDMASGQVHVNFGPHVNVAVLSRGGRMVATLGRERSSKAPEVPTMTEAGLSKVAFESEQLFYVRAGTPTDHVERLSREVNAVLAEPQVRERLERLALKPKGSSPEAMRQTQAAAYRAWTLLAREYRLGAE